MSNATTTTAAPAARKAAPARKAALTAEQIASLVKQNQELQTQLNMLSSQVAAPAVAQAMEQVEREPELRQRLWLNDGYRVRHTRVEGRRALFFSAQKSLRRQDGTRFYGEVRQFVAYGEMADAAEDILRSSDRLIDIEAWEHPFVNDTKQSEWVVTRIAAVPRQAAAPAAAPALLPFSSEPTGEEVDF